MLKKCSTHVKNVKCAQNYGRKISRYRVGDLEGKSEYDIKIKLRQTRREAGDYIELTQEWF
jgi:hypothetical protein